ncbi:exodeoxyribonuclease VII large subunit [Anaerococcus hydrogenalis]|uniref:Exodeoxyribonuclease 7 large subunit n=1 Tax=Anaerococcus hydrogenalis TaxID=33029 RepID=A0A2N6ULK5_9FIRM|nr:exodeoxyribonuclease VII large subunit [Anaerococcus hydrogenalis]MDK7694641.1 exodeoxyribonuclease VII large subunit [Anaerococcus hydrogenalis]MDK7696419.1 exodeoxyribonuclease VII large subunit [Anaerococcus hydrogenalis]MDK7707668.1 exodeoxyribonuclease VII large subunit [Anaerococcus hydrogenalis]PMC82679.1 exodeoxyribonuclease VII large subunit [Anaerococcus hydrogenalis]
MKSLSVKQFNQYIKTSIKLDPLFQNVSIKGEIANYKISHNHIYFSLKEDEEVIDCAIYYYEDKDLGVYNNGDEVIVEGNLIYNSFFSKISIAVNNIESKGLSEDYIKFLKLKEDFYKKGYFDQERKKSIISYPKNIGLITSDKSAAIVDFISVINKEISDINIYLYPVKVQGLSAKSEIINAIDILDEKKLDAIVITRGGGSKEDLKVFNEKDLVEKIYKAKSPIISAIGHKIDLSLTDLVSDVSLQTPTEAGSYLVRNYKKIRDKINDLFINIKKTLNRNIDLKELKLGNLGDKLELYKIENLLEKKSNDLNLLFDKFNKTIENDIRQKENKISLLKYRLNSINSILEIKKKSIYIKDLEDKLIYSKNSLKIKDKVKIVFSDGEVKAEIYDG